MSVPSMAHDMRKGKETLINRVGEQQYQEWYGGIGRDNTNDAFDSLHAAFRRRRPSDLTHLTILHCNGRRDSEI